MATTVWSWDPFREMESLRRELDRVLENVGAGGWTSPFTRYSFLPGRSARAYPLLNISDDADNMYIEGLAPGLNPDALKVTVVRDQLTISGEKMGMMGKEVPPESCHRSERAAGKFTRTITLPYPADGDKVKAEYKNGLLWITLPKAVDAKPKQIAIHVD